MSEDQLPVPAPGVLFQPVDDGAILLHAEDEIYFGLNAVGARIWELLSSQGTTFSELHATLQEEYPVVDAGTLKTDVAELLHSLEEAGLLVSEADLRG